MKLNIEIDMSPEEARRLMGLPDVTALNARIVEELGKRVAQADPEIMMKAWMGGMEKFQSFLWDAASRVSKDPKPGK
ncbi:MAG: hypothetical protein KGJ78_05960 [Alphaproteobacteria bacterium]|nr:hypothetical protein [Alphaproteobacteria bacterium]